MTAELTDDPSSALSAVPAAGDRRGTALAAELRFFYGPMDCGKSTLALQINHNHRRQGRRGLVLTKLDRSTAGRVSSRIGLEYDAVEVGDDTDLRQLVRARWATGTRVDFLICDEAQFYTADQIEQLADLVDDSCVDVYAFGLATDFRSRMFPATQRLFELADEIVRLQVEVLCWCGRRGQHNARVHDGAMVTEGARVVVADTAAGSADVRYQVLCRRHHRSGDLGPASGAAGQLRLT